MKTENGSILFLKTAAAILLGAGLTLSCVSVSTPRSAPSAAVKTTSPAPAAKPALSEEEKARLAFMDQIRREYGIILWNCFSFQSVPTFFGSYNNGDRAVYEFYTPEQTDVPIDGGFERKLIGTENGLQRWRIKGSFAEDRFDFEALVNSHILIAQLKTYLADGRIEHDLDWSESMQADSGNGFMNRAWVPQGGVYDKEKETFVFVEGWDAMFVGEEPATVGGKTVLTRRYRVPGDTGGSGGGAGGEMSIWLSDEVPGSLIRFIIHRSPEEPETAPDRGLQLKEWSFGE